MNMNCQKLGKEKLDRTDLHYPNVNIRIIEILCLLVVMNKNIMRNCSKQLGKCVGIKLIIDFELPKNLQSSIKNLAFFSVFFETSTILLCWKRFLHGFWNCALLKHVSQKNIWAFRKHVSSVENILKSFYTILYNSRLFTK